MCELCNSFHFHQRFSRKSLPLSKLLHFLSLPGCHIAITLQQTVKGKHKGKDVLLHHGFQ